MKRDWAYFKYVVKHKWYVMLECFRVGLYWRAITHDLTKFPPAEFGPYARNFYCTDGSRRNPDQVTTTEKIEFNRAWSHHFLRNPHHWEYWTLRPNTQYQPQVMPVKYIEEMVCDWRGAARAIAGKDNTREWYKENRKRMKLHLYTQELVEKLLEL